MAPGTLTISARTIASSARCWAARRPARARASSSARRERAVQVVVGAGVERGVRGALGRRDGEREQPCVVGAMVLAQPAADAGDVRARPARGRRSRGRRDPRRARRARSGRRGPRARHDRPHGPTAGSRARPDRHEHAGLPAPHCSRMRHAQTVPSFACRSGAQKWSSTRLWCGGYRGSSPSGVGPPAAARRRVGTTWSGSYRRQRAFRFPRARSAPSRSSASSACCR